MIALSLALPWAIRFGLVVLLGVSLVSATGRHAWRRSARAIVGFAIDDDGACAVRLRSSETWHEARLIERWVHPWLTILVVRHPGSRWRSSLLLPADAVPADAFRRLRVRLRLQSAAA